MIAKTEIGYKSDISLHNPHNSVQVLDVGRSGSRISRETPTPRGATTYYLVSHASVILFTIGLMDTWSLLILVGYSVTPRYGAVGTHPTGMLFCSTFLHKTARK